MQLLITCLVIYALTILFSLLIAAALQGLGVFIKRLNLDPEEELDLSVPSSDSEREQESVAVAIAVATAARAARIPLKPSSPTS